MVVPVVSVMLLVSRVRGGGVELAVHDAVDEALPLVAVEHRDPSGGIAGHPHEDPVAAGPDSAAPGSAGPGGSGAPRRGGREGDLDRAVAVPRPFPVQPGSVDAEVGGGRLGLPV